MSDNILYHGAELESVFSDRYYTLMRNALDALSELIGKERAHTYFASLPQFRSPCYLWTMLESEYDRQAQRKDE